MVLEEAGDPRRAVAPAAEHATVAHEVIAEEPARLQRLVAQHRAVERARRLGDRAEHETVPAREHLLVAPRAHTRGARLEEPRPHPRERRDGLGAAQSAARSRFGERQRDVEDVRALEVPAAGDAPVRLRDRRILARQRAELRERPHIELAFMPFAVGVERGVPAADRIGHLVAQPMERLLGDATRFGVAGRLPEMHGEPREQRVVVEHLLEVRHEPDGVDGVAVEAARELVVDAAARHLREREARDAQPLRLARARPLPQQRVEHHRLRELGCRTEAARLGVEPVARRADRLAERERGE